MRYISSEKELKRISIYTNMPEIESLLSMGFYKSDLSDKDEKINVAIIDSAEPFFIKKIRDSEIIFDVTGGYPQIKKTIYRGTGKDNRKNSKIWLEFIMTLFSVDSCSEPFSLVEFFKEMEDYRKIKIKKYPLTKEIIQDLDNYEKMEVSRKNKKRMLLFLINTYVVFPNKDKNNLKFGMERKYGIKSFLKGSKIMFAPESDILGHVFEIEKSDM
ncbi:hypothetical protein [Fusobacterium sp. MFO224]|uniref:hypothetical protein n=1 Tax=Fusobacterium sp. MFO224 TaxID=3378070 RepID=UPI0038549D4A